MFEGVLGGGGASIGGCGAGAAASVAAVGFADALGHGVDVAPSVLSVAGGGGEAGELWLAKYFGISLLWGWKRP